MENIEVPVGECRCPGSPHEQDMVYLAPELGLTAGLAVEAAMASSDGEGQTIAVSLALINHNIVEWTFTDEAGVVAITPANIQRLLPYAKGGEAVANRAAGLYLNSFFAPLQARLGLPPSRTNGQTRPILQSHRPSRRKRSASSSPDGSAGKP